MLVQCKNVRHEDAGGVSRRNLTCPAPQMMEEGPPLSAGRGRQQIAMTLHRSRAVVVSGHGKGTARLCQMYCQETNASEPCDEAS